MADELPLWYFNKFVETLEFNEKMVVNFLKKYVLFQFLTLAHKGWGYSRPLRRPGGGGGHKAFGCSTA